jgi:hypothetical protein
MAALPDTSKPKTIIEDMMNMDPKEVVERETAAESYLGETEKHFVSFLDECQKESRLANHDLRESWEKCWKAYQLERDYSNKEEWQSKVITADPLAIGQQFKAIVRKALVDTEDYFDITGEPGTDALMADVWKHKMKFLLDNQHADFPTVFADACEMAAVIGTSMEMLPMFDVTPMLRKKLIFKLIEPWKIFRCPDAEPRDPQSGMYWIHEEYIDKWALKAAEKRGLYAKIDQAAKSGTDSGDDGENDEERDARRRDQVWTRNKFRDSLLVREYRGVVLSPDGNVLLPNGVYSIAGGVVIRKPKASIFPTCRWPGTAFGPMPHLLRFEGRSIIEGILGLWNLSDSLFNLHVDDMNWIINRMFEINPDLLMDRGADSEVFPGKVWLRSAGNAAARAIQEVAIQRSHTNEILPNLEYMQKKIQNGSFVNNFVTGGMDKANGVQTLGQEEIRTHQSMGVFDSFGANLEKGAEYAIRTAIDLVTCEPGFFESIPFDKKIIKHYPEFIDSLSLLTNPRERRRQLGLDANLKVTGISAMLNKSNMIQKLNQFAIQAGNPIYGPFMKPYEILTAQAKALSLDDQDMIKTDEEVQKEKEAELQRQMVMNAAGGMLPAPGGKPPVGPQPPVKTASGGPKDMTKGAQLTSHPTAG